VQTSTYPCLCIPADKELHLTLIKVLHILYSHSVGLIVELMLIFNHLFALQGHIIDLFTSSIETYDYYANRKKNVILHCISVLEIKGELPISFTIAWDSFIDINNARIA
jgi:hypothetical protein